MNPIFEPTTLLALQSSGPLGALGGFVPMILIFVIFYVVLMLPMQRQRKALAQMIETLKKGDRVITSGGLYGEVTAVEGPTVMLRIADNVRVRVAKSAISGLEGDGEKADKGGKSDKGSTS
ncbi:MAG: preprotein translocase subunit YajC [Acidobacteriota bacterium]|jgi:preprotein translocase subunit YajC|nr:preprotein translocase subunit YajC [Acidobacteriota bacterium]